MIRKILCATALLTSSVCLAVPVPYIGAGTGVLTNTASYSNYRGAPVNVLFGYGGVLNGGLFFAGELDGTVATGEISNYGPVKTTYSYGVSLLPGVMVSNHTLLFGRAGIVGTRFTTPDSTQSGVQFGLGLQTSLTQNVDLRGEYDYTAYSSFNSVGLSYSPRSDAATVSLIYKFT